MSAVDYRINRDILRDYIKSYYELVIHDLPVNYGRVAIKFSDESSPLDQLITPNPVLSIQPPEGKHDNTSDSLSSISDKEQHKAKDVAFFEPFSDVFHPITKGSSSHDDIIKQLTSISTTIQPLADHYENNHGHIDSSQLIGKGLVLGRDVESGDVIFAERPFIHTSDSYDVVSCCRSCMRPLGTMEQQTDRLLSAQKTKKQYISRGEIDAFLEVLQEFKPSIQQYVKLNCLEEDEGDVGGGDGDIDVDVEGQPSSLASIANSTKFKDAQKSPKQKYLAEYSQKIQQFFTDVYLKAYHRLNSGSDPDVQCQLPLKLPIQHIFSPSEDQLDVPPVNCIYTGLEYCSLRCLMVAYHSYDHVFAHAYDDEELQLPIGAEDTPIPFPDSSTTSSDMTGGGVDDQQRTLQCPPLYKDLISFSTSTNPMFLSHAHGVVKMLVQWGMSMVHSVGGSYRDIIVLLSLRGGGISSTTRTPFLTEIVDMQTAAAIHNHYTGAVDDSMIQIPSDSFTQISKGLGTSYDVDFVAEEQNLSQQFDNLVTLLTQHGSNIAQVLEAKLAIIRQQYQSKIRCDSQQSEPPSQSLLSQCTCSKCLADSGFPALQVAIFPFILFSQTLWWCHVHDSNQKNFYTLTDLTSTAASTTPGTAATTTSSSSSPSSPPVALENSLFAHQQELCNSFSELLQPIILNYCVVVSQYLSLFTRIYHPDILSSDLLTPTSPVSSETPCMCLATNDKHDTLSDAVIRMDITPSSNNRDESHSISPYYLDCLQITPGEFPTPPTYNEMLAGVNDIPSRLSHAMNVLQRPLDLSKATLLAMMVSMCEMNNISLVARSAAEDAYEYFTIHNVKDLDVDDLDVYEEQVELMYCAAVQAYIASTQPQTNASQSQILTKQLPSQDKLINLPPYLKNSDEYVDYILSKTKLITNYKKLHPVVATPTAATGKATSKLGGADNKSYFWSIFGKRVQKYPSGSGLFQIACTMNHHCNPNVSVLKLNEGRDNMMAFVANRDIKQGEELCIAYIETEDAPLRARRELLADYGFVCGCEICLADEYKLQQTRKKRIQSAPTKGKGKK